MPLLSTIDLEIYTPMPDQKISLHAVIAYKSTTNKVPVFYKCKDKCNWYTTRRYTCVKTSVNCGITCHGGGDNDNIECPNLEIPHLRSCKSLQVRDRDNEGKSSKRQRSGTARKDGI